MYFLIHIAAVIYTDLTEATVVEAAETAANEDSK